MPASASTVWITGAMVYGFIFLALALTPRIMPRTTPFGVRVPGPPEADPAVMRAVADSRRVFFRLLALAAVIMAAAALALNPTHYPEAAILTLALGSTTLGFVAYYAAHVRLRRAKQREQWYRGLGVGAAASVGAPPAAGFDGFQLIAVSLVLAVVVLAVLRYPSLGPRVPVHFDLSGMPNRFVPKSFGAMLLVVGIPGAAALFIAATARWVTAARSPLDPSHPKSSSLQADVFAHRTRMVIGLTADVVAVETLARALTAWGVVRPDPLVQSLSVLLPVLGLVAAVITVGLATGQNGSRVPVPREAASGLVARDDDRFWIAGQVYVNRSDPALLVPRRFGFGYTLNMRHPAAWLMAAAALALVGWALFLHR